MSSSGEVLVTEAEDSQDVGSEQSKLQNVPGVGFVVAFVMCLCRPGPVNHICPQNRGWGAKVGGWPCFLQHTLVFQ
jgi:hypothetical protein